MTELVYGLILAGGRSSRMGQDKALVPFEGIPLLKRVARVAEICTDRVYILTPWQERYTPITPKSWQFIPEPEPDQGPLVALTQGLAHFSRGEVVPQWILLLACDLPCLDAMVITDWRSQLARLDRSCLALVPKHQNSWEPLCAFYRMECLVALAQCQTRSLQTWLGSVPVAEITLERKEMLKNCNTPQDIPISVRPPLPG